MENIVVPFFQQQSCFSIFTHSVALIAFFLSSSKNVRYWGVEVVGAYCEKEKGSKENIDNTAENLAF